MTISPSRRNQAWLFGADHIAPDCSEAVTRGNQLWAAHDDTKAVTRGAPLPDNENLEVIAR